MPKKNMSSVNTNNTELFFQKNIKENPAACIFVANLNKNVGDNELKTSIYRRFQEWGNILSVKVLKDWLKRPYAFVQFESEQDSKICLKEATGTFIHGRSLRCEPARVNRTICLISNGQPYNQKLLQMMLAKYGDIEDVSVIQPQGKFYYAFIKYKYRCDAITAYLTLKGHIGDTKDHYHPWTVEWSSNFDITNVYQPLHMTYCYLDRKCIFIGNLHASTREVELRDLFEIYGKIQNIHVVRRSYSNKTKRVYAFLRYYNEEDTVVAIKNMNGILWKDGFIRVNYREYYYPYTLFTSDGVYFNKQTFMKSGRRFPQQTDMGPSTFMPYCAFDLYYMGMPVEQKPILTTTTTGTFHTTNVYNTVSHHQPYYTEPYPSVTYFPYYDYDKKCWNQ